MARASCWAVALWARWRWSMRRYRSGTRGGLGSRRWPRVSEPPAPMGGKRRAVPARVEPFGALRTDPDCGGCTRYRMCPTCAAEQVAADDAAR